MNLAKEVAKTQKPSSYSSGKNNDNGYGKKWFNEGARGDRAAANYSEALMNSIWGLYNRYSVHNFKSSTSSKAGEVMFHQARSGNGKE